VEFPVRAVMAIYARENERGMMFNTDHDSDDDDGLPPREDPPAPPRPPVRKKPVLKIVK